jgi:D-glycero-alpha-D-manno-heptose-7-phosphate kinase
MLIARSPLRISLGGGGTDLPSYYKKYGGFLIAATINKYVYISLAETFNKKFIIKYSDFEEEKKITNINTRYLERR